MKRIVMLLSLVFLLVLCSCSPSIFSHKDQKIVVLVVGLDYTKRYDSIEKLKFKVGINDYYVNELDEEIDKKQEELEQKEKEKNNKAGMPIWKNKIFIGIVIVVVVIIAYIIGVSIYKARLRKRYFGSYKRLSRKKNKFVKKKYKF